MKKFLTPFSILTLFLFLVLTSCQPESVRPGDNDTTPTVKKESAPMTSAFVEIDQNTAFVITEHREVMVNIPTADPNIQMRMAFPDVATYEATINAGMMKYDLADFQFLVNRAVIKGKKVESHMVLESYDDIAASIAKGKVPMPLSTGGVIARGTIGGQGNAEAAPVIDLTYDPVAVEIDEMTADNCPLFFGCSGDCAFAAKIDGVWYLAVGDCRRSGIVCYCHTTSITPQR
jgi:hypothetical protein